MTNYVNIILSYLYIKKKPSARETRGWPPGVSPVHERRGRPPDVAASTQEKEVGTVGVRRRHGTPVHGEPSPVLHGEACATGTRRAARRPQCRAEFATDRRSEGIRFGLLK